MNMTKEMEREWLIHHLRGAVNCLRQIAALKGENSERAIHWLLGHGFALEIGDCLPFPDETK
jgi:hypothetical protein